METNINITTINKHFSPNETPHNKNNIKYRTSIVPYSFFTINEATISNKISKILYYSNYFSILDDYESLTITELNENIIEKLTTTTIINNSNNNDNQYYLFKYLDDNSIDFIDNLYNFISIKKLIMNNIDYFFHMLNGLSILNKNDICYFNFLPKNIIFLKEYREKPVFANFNVSVRINKLDYNYISTIIGKITDFTYQPIEIHILFYFIKNDMTTISYSFIEEFCEDFIANLHILPLFTENYKNTYKANCVETMKKYINQSKKDIINDILERNDKWDIYGISMLYIKIFGCITKVFSLKNNFISKITIELLKNIHPDSDKRMSIEETINTVDKLLNEEKDWSFINNLTNLKLDQLFNEFSN